MESKSFCQLLPVYWECFGVFTWFRPLLLLYWFWGVRSGCNLLQRIQQGRLLPQFRNGAEAEQHHQSLLRFACSWRRDVCSAGDDDEHQFGGDHIQVFFLSLDVLWSITFSKCWKCDKFYWVREESLLVFE